MSKKCSTLSPLNEFMSNWLKTREVTKTDCNTIQGGLWGKENDVDHCGL